MRRFTLRPLLLVSSLAGASACLRRVETLEPTPCPPAAAPTGHSAIAWTALSPQPGVVAGRVIRLDNGEPPPEVIVRLWPDSTRHHLGPSGTFRFASADSASHTLEVLAIGFERVAGTFQLRPGSGTEILVVLAPALLTFDECGLAMTRVRRWHIGFP